MATDDKLKALTENIEFANDGTKTGRGNAGEILLLSGEDEVRRVPVPTSDPNDPLNFTKWRKLGVTITCCWFCACAPICFQHPY